MIGLLVTGAAIALDLPAPTETVPNETSALKDIEAFLYQRTGLWNVRKVTEIRAGTSSFNGRPAYVMQAMLDVTLATTVTPSQRDIKNEPWLTKLAGSKGETKSVAMTLTWVKNGSEWKLRTLD